MRCLAGIVLLAVSLLAEEQVEITAKYFMANEAERKTVMQGDVVAIKGKDRLTSRELVVFFDETNRPQRYEAEGEVKFSFTLPDGRTLTGSSDRAIFDALKNEYTLKGGAVLEESGKNNTIKGEHIIINRVSGFANVAGDDTRPARLIFTFKEKPSEDETQEEADQNNQTQEASNQKASGVETQSLRNPE